jgi:hypothetical protein
LGRHRGAQEDIAGAQREQLFDAVVLDVVHLGLARRTGFQEHVLGSDAAAVPGTTPFRKSRRPLLVISKSCFMSSSRCKIRDVWDGR